MEKLEDHHSKSLYHSKSKMDPQTIGIAGTIIGILFEIGTIKHFITKLYRLKNCFLKKKTHFEILELLEPMVSIKYKPLILDNSQSIKERFFKLKNKEIDTSKILKLSTCTLNDSNIILESRDIKNTTNVQSDLFIGKYIPDIERLKIPIIINGYSNINQVIEDIKNLNISDHQLEALLKDINFGELKKNNQESILSLIKKSSLRNIYLKGSIFIDSPYFKQLDLKSIKKIQLENCSNLKSFSDIFIYKPIQLPVLTHLKFRNCEKLGIVDINAPNLKTLYVKRCPNFQNISTLSPNLKFLNLKGSINNLEILEYINNYNNLIYLNISKSSILNSNVHLNFEQLETLIIKDVEILKSIYLILPKVNSIDLTGCNNITKIFCKEKEIEKLRGISNHFSSFIGLLYSTKKTINYFRG
ncbi:hypothetical protein ACTA71_005902 [Dictyostelium dimigraforme]